MSSTTLSMPDSQQFVCLSFLRNKENDKCTVTGVRFAGAYTTYEEACARAKEIQQIDTYHHVFVGDAGKWLPYDPDPNSDAVKDSEYADQQLNELMKGHRENQERAKVFHEMRKNEKIMDNINDNLGEKNKNKDELASKLSNAQNMDEVTTLTNSIESIDDQIKKMTERLEECRANEVKLKAEVGDAVPPTDSM